MMPRIALVLITLLLLPLHVFAQNADDIFAGKNLDTIRLLRRLQQQNNAAAVRKLQDDARCSGDCTVLQGNSLVFVSDFDNKEFVTLRQLMSCWVYLERATPLLRQAGDAYGGVGQFKGHDQNRRMKEMNVLTLDVMALVDEAQSCFVPILATRGLPQLTPPLARDNPPDNQDGQPIVPPGKGNPGRP
jgi:hypothetical protein